MFCDIFSSRQQRKFRAGNWSGKDHVQSELNTHRNFSQVRHIHYNRSIWNYMGNSCHNWQIMVQVLVNFYDSEMYIFWKCKRSISVGLGSSSSSKILPGCASWQPGRSTSGPGGLLLQPLLGIRQQQPPWPIPPVPHGLDGGPPGGTAPRRPEGAVGRGDPPPATAGLAKQRLIPNPSNLLGFISCRLRIIFQVKQKN